MLSEILERHLQAVKAQTQNPVVPAVTPFAEPKTGENACTFKQVNFYKMLVDKKQLTDEQRTHLKQALSAFDRRSIGATIEWLVGLPWQPRPIVQRQTNAVSATVTAKIDQGRYAIVHPAGDLRFYEVRKPKEGKWAGFVFLSQLSGENHIPMKDKNERDVVYGIIAKDVMGALKLYGQKIGRCGHCRKQLTDAVSREFGIGPVCRKALGI